MLFPVDVIEIVDAVLQPAFAYLAIPPPLLRRGGRRRYHLCLPQLRAQVNFPLPGLRGETNSGSGKHRGGEEGLGGLELRRVAVR